MTQPPPTPHRTHPLIRACLCLLSGLAVWWGLAWWLEPKPLWQVTLRDKEIQIPLHELPEKQLLLVSKFQVGPLDASGLALLDLQTGKLRHEITPDFSLRFESSSNTRPRWHRDSYYWLSTKDNALRLWRWQPESGGKEQQVHQWKFQDSFCSQVVWPEGSDTFMLVWNWPWELIATALQRDIYMQWLVSLCVEEDWSTRNWAMQVWKLPEVGQGKLQHLASRHATHWDIRKPALSDDGRWTASVRYQDFSRGQVRHQLQRMGTASVDNTMWQRLLLLESNQILINPVNAVVPSVQHTVEAGSVVNHMYWAGSYLIASGWKQKPIKPLPANQLWGTVLPQDARTAFMVKANWIFAWDGKTLKSLQWPTQWDSSDWDWHYQSNELVGISKYSGDRQRAWVVLERVNDQLRIKQSLPKFSQEERLSYHAASRQLVAAQRIEPADWERQVRAWAERFPWLMSAVNLLFPRDRYETMVYDLALQRTVARWGNQYAMNTVPTAPRELNQLYTVSYRGSEPENMVLLTLNCYAFPIVMWSSWWSRGTGILVVLLSWLVLTRRARRQKVLQASSE